MFTWNQHVKIKSQSDNKLKPTRLVKECTVSARLSAAAPSARIGLPLRDNVSNVLFWLQIRHTHKHNLQLDNGPYQTQNRVAPKKFPFTRTYARPAPRPEAPSSPIRFNRRSNSVRDVFWLQVRHKHTLIMTPIINPKKSGGVLKLHTKCTKALQKKIGGVIFLEKKNCTYAKPSPIEAAPVSPILLLNSNSVCNVLFELHVKHKLT